jgi:DNA-binding response OmpR family regulator
MPLMNGLQLVSSLRKKDIHNKVPVIVLGDEIPEKDKKEYKNLKVDTYLPINSSVEKLSVALEEIIFI